MFLVTLGKGFIRIWLTRVPRYYEINAYMTKGIESFLK